MKKIILLFILSIYTLSSIDGKNRLKSIKPEKAGMSSEHLSLVDGVINESIRKGEIPGAVIAVVRGNEMVYLKAYGNKSVAPDTIPMTVNTIFDLASVSKSVGTTLSFMQLIERGKIRLTDPVNMYLKGFEPYIDVESGEKINIRVVDLLTHTSGLPPYAAPAMILERYGEATPEKLLQYISTCKRDFKPTTNFQYSCLNFVTLQYILEKITGERLCDYAKRNVFNILGMNYTSYLPIGESINPEFLSLCAPTEKEADGKIVLGEVHDPIARIINKGNSGNAGVFSNAEDLAILAAALMNDGEINGNRILGKLTIERMTEVPSEVITLGRSLGWDNYSPYASNNGNLFNRTETFGHTGYTGTSFVVDPTTKTAVILLAHRVHPVDKGSVVRLRALVANIVAGSITK